MKEGSFLKMIIWVGYILNLLVYSMCFIDIGSRLFFFYCYCCCDGDIDVGNWDIVSWLNVINCRSDVVNCYEYGIL